MSAIEIVDARTSPSRAGFASPAVARTLLLAVAALSFAAGLLLTESGAAARAIASGGGDWANLLRAMAALKVIFAGAATAAVSWRLGAPISATRWCAYALAAAAAWAGPALIWGLAHIALGAFLLHAGVIAMAVMVWRDPATQGRLSEILAHRRAAARSRS